MEDRCGLNQRIIKLGMLQFLAKLKHSISVLLPCRRSLGVRRFTHHAGLWTPGVQLGLAWRSSCDSVTPPTVVAAYVPQLVRQDSVAGRHRRRTICSHWSPSLGIAASLAPVLEYGQYHQALSAWPLQIGPWSATGQSFLLSQQLRLQPGDKLVRQHRLPKVLSLLDTLLDTWVSTEEQPTPVLGVGVHLLLWLLLPLVKQRALYPLETNCGKTLSELCHQKVVLAVLLGRAGTVESISRSLQPGHQVHQLGSAVPPTE